MNHLTVKPGDTLYVKEAPYRRGGEPQLSELIVRKVGRLYCHASTEHWPESLHKFRLEDGGRVENFVSARAWMTAEAREHDAVVIAKRERARILLRNLFVDYRWSEADLDTLIELLERAK